MIGLLLNRIGYGIATSSALRSQVGSLASPITASNSSCGLASWMTMSIRNVRGISGRLFYRRRPRQHKAKPMPKTKWLEGKSQVKGVVTKLVIANPVKPNSAQRRCARVKLPSGRVVLAYIPGIGHNLQVHSIVRIRGGRTRDLIGARYKVIRGLLDCTPVKNRVTSRSKYGIKLNKETKAIQAAKYHNQFLVPSSSKERRQFFLRTGIYTAPDSPLPDVFSSGALLRRFDRPASKFSGIPASRISGYNSWK